MRASRANGLIGRTDKCAARQGSLAWSRMVAFPTRERSSFLDHGEEYSRMEATNDPAGRLHEFLSYCRQNNRHQARVQHIWSEYFAVDLGGVDYANALVAAISLPAQVRTALHSLPLSATTPTAFLVDQLPRLEEALTWGLNNQSAGIGSFLEQYDDADVARVELMSHMLRGLAPAAVTQEVLDEISGLGEQIAHLVDGDETMEPDLRALLLDLANGIRSVVQSYAIRGPEALARERDLLIGRLLSNPDLAAKLRGHKTAYHLVRDTVLVATAALTFFNSGAQAMENAPKVIEHVQHVAQLFTPSDTDPAKQIEMTHEP